MPDDVSRVIEQIRILTATESDHDELLRLVHRLASFAPLSIGTVFAPGAALYRGTNHHTCLPARIEEIWFPPSHAVPSFGRANMPGSPMFYCCSDPNGAFREIGTSLRQYAVLAKWEATQWFVVHDVGYTSEVLKRAGSRRELPEHHIRFQEKIPTAERNVRDFLALAFTDPTPAHYRLTAAIAEMYMACDGVAGIMYPAVAKWANVDNFAFTPTFIRSGGLRLVEATLAYMDEVTADVIGGSVVARLAAVDDGSLRWEYTADQTTTIDPGGVAMMSILPGERKRITGGDGRLTINGRTYDIKVGYSIELDDSVIVVRDLQGRILPPVA